MTILLYVHRSEVAYYGRGKGGEKRAGEWRFDRGYRPKKTGENVDRRLNNGSVKAVSPRHCAATSALRNCYINCTTSSCDFNLLLVASAHGGLAVRSHVHLRVDALRANLVIFLRFWRVPGTDVTLQIAPAHQHLAAIVTPVRSVALRVKTHVLVEVAGVAEGSKAHLALQGLVARVRPQVDLQPVLAGVELAAVDAQVAFAGLAGEERGREKVQGLSFLLWRHWEEREARLGAGGPGVAARHGAAAGAVGHQTASRVAAVPRRDHRHHHPLTTRQL